MTSYHLQNLQNLVAKDSPVMLADQNNSDHDTKMLYKTFLFTRGEPIIGTILFICKTCWTQPSFLQEVLHRPDHLQKMFFVLETGPSQWFVKGWLIRIIEIICTKILYVLTISFAKGKTIHTISLIYQESSYSTNLLARGRSVPTKKNVAKIVQKKVWAVFLARRFHQMIWIICKQYCCTGLSCSQEAGQSRWI